MRLIREIRCYPDDRHEAVPNTWAGTGSGTILGAYRVLRAVVEGPVDRRTGYLCDIKDIDRILRTVVAAGLQTRGEGTGSDSPSLAAALANVFPHAARGLRPAALRSLELHASPHTRLAVDERGAGMIRLTQSFEFSAAHRLFCKELSDEENRRLFGKCSNPKGHGHNYVVEVTVCGTVDSGKGTVADVGHVDRVVLERVIEPFDHKNLNLECAEFAQLNPSVENIARVIWDRLAGAFDGCRLASVRVWETPKTCAEYTGGDERITNY
jgi:6-pyruvoyltetrahydropterin/6-carboxytetrahydropterin synthase